MKVWMKFFVVLTLALSLASGAAFAEDEAEASLYERLGGWGAVTAVIDDFVNRAAANPAVNFTRQGNEQPWDATPENVVNLKLHLSQFVAVATGATDVVYEGKDLKSSHEGMKITNAEFDAIAGDLKATLDKFNVPEKEQQELLAIVGTTRGAIVEVQE